MNKKTAATELETRPSRANANNTAGGRSMAAIPILQARKEDADSGKPGVTAKKAPNKETAGPDFQQSVADALFQRKQKYGTETIQKAGATSEEEPVQGKFVAQREGMQEEEPVQKVGEEEEPLQGKFVAQREAMQEEEPVQKVGEEEEPLQGKFVAQREGMQEEEPVQKVGEEEEPVQGKFVAQLEGMREEEPVQKVGEEEEPVQGKFVAQLEGMREEEPVQKVGEEEEPVQGKFVAQLEGMLEEEPVQKVGEEEEPVQGKFVAQLEGMQEEEPVQKVGEEEEPVQGKFGGQGWSQSVQMKANNTGLPDNLKSGIEALGGYDMGDVKVHYNSAKPATLQAHAYAQGTDIHIGPGQERHLPHEAWHVVQQKQGRVKATMQMKGGVPVNDDKGLEQEADVMGSLATSRHRNDAKAKLSVRNATIDSGVLQGFWPFTGPSLYAMFMGGDDAGQQQQEAPPEKEPPRLTRRELIRQQEQRSRARRHVTNSRLINLPKTLRDRLIAIEDGFNNAAMLLPRLIREQWDTDEPAIVDASVRPLFGTLRGVGAFRGEEEADAAEQSVNDLDAAKIDYVTLINAVLPVLAVPREYFNTYRAGFPEPLITSFFDSCGKLRTGVISVDVITKEFRDFVPKAKSSSALTTQQLQELHTNNAGVAMSTVADYFRLGRISIGHNRSFYKSEGFDDPAGKFGGEWALKANDGNLQCLQKDWVFHCHGQALGDKSIHNYTGFTIARALGASHIKQKALERELGVSITVDQPASFDAIEAADKDRFTNWSTSPFGMAALKKRKG